MRFSVRVVRDETAENRSQKSRNVTDYPGSSGGPSYTSPASSEDDALDLGATVIPILVKTYGPQAAIALLALVIGYLLGRRKG